MTDNNFRAAELPGEKENDHPESVGRYRIIRRLGEGGMGSVFLAQDTILLREVALKLPLSGTENDPEVRERFLREARSAATLDHPYICRVYDADEVDGRLYLAMAYIEGQSLADLVRAEGMPPRQVVALVGKLAIALNEAHVRGVVHRDLKPRNVMIRTTGSKREPVIVDFGLARLETTEDIRMTKTGQVMGTPAYMAPEQLRGKPDEIGPPCDIYALGVILYELLTGRLPFSGNYAVLVAQILTQPPLPPSTHRPGLDTSLDAICLKAIAKDVSERYASMMELASALTGHLRGTPSEPSSGRPVAPITRPIEGDSIPTGADTLVYQLLGRDDDEARPKSLKIGPPPSRIVRTPEKIPLPITVEETGPSPWALMILGPMNPIIVASAILGFFLMAGIVIVATNREGQPKIEVNAPADPVPPVVTEVEPTPPPMTPPETKEPDPPADIPKLADEPKPVVETPIANLSDKPKPVVETPPAQKVDDTLNTLTNTIGMELKLIPAGTFAMGSDASDPEAFDDEKVDGKKHRVRITRPFYLGTTEVTVGQFRQFVEKSGYNTEAESDGRGGESWDEQAGRVRQDPKYTWRSPGFEQADDHPVVIVSWNDARAFCDWLGLQEGQAYRLPSEAEWEYSCRAGKATRYWSGNDREALATVANLADGTGKEKFPMWIGTITAKDGFVFTSPVGRFPSNGFGLFDMHGNAWEWCADWYDSNYYAKGPPADPLNSSRAAHQVIRGGSWGDTSRNSRSASRSKEPPGFRNFKLGFRVLRVRSGQ